MNGEQLAATDVDWGQVVANGGPPCFHVDEGRFCLRAYRWEGHGPMHTYRPLAAYIESVIAAERKQCEDAVWKVRNLPGNPTEVRSMCAAAIRARATQPTEQERKG